MTKFFRVVSLASGITLAQVASGVTADIKPPAFASALPDQLFVGMRSPETLAVQVLLDHSGHSPGVIDGVMGGNTSRAIKAFQKTNNMSVDGKISKQLMQELRAEYSGEMIQTYTIAADDIAGPFVSVPPDMEGQANLDALGFESPAEGLAEKFHMAQSLLSAMNPGADFSSAGSNIVVVVPSKNELATPVARIEVDKSRSELRAFAADGTLVATYPATIGSSTFPSPSGRMEVRAIAPAPTYHFDPQGRDWGPDKRLTIAAGPNNPVGGTWIDLTKEGYGIHGTPEPRLIGKTNSHGCVRLTNWDAEELAKAVSQGTTVEFV